MSGKHQPNSKPAKAKAKTRSGDLGKANARARTAQKKPGRGKAEAAPPRGASAAVRAGTKQGLVIELLSRSAGASLNDLVSATGWLPHTTRAALTGLRRKGYTIEKSKGADGQTSYRIDPVRSTGAAKEAAA